MKKIFIAFLIFLNLSGKINAAEIPRVNLDEAERYFNNACVHFMRRDYREAQMYLDQAINANTYMVDYYLLSALNLNRMGDAEGSMSSLSSYLEVRPMDNSAPRIERYFDEQDRILRTVLGTAPVPVNWRYSQTNAQTEWNTGYTRPFSIKGLGKVKSLGEVVCIPDTFGDKIYLHQKNSSGNLAAGVFVTSKAFQEIEVPLPVISIPMGDGTFRIFNADGELYSLKNSSLNDETISADYEMTLPSFVISDADFIAENFFAVSDPADRNVAFYNLRNSEILMRRWQPPLGAGDLLFEPVAVESYADWLAVADRANNRIYIVNIINQEYFMIRGISKPRDLLWSSFGELFVLNEDGEIYNFVIDFGTRSYANKYSSAMYKDMENIWSFYHSPEGDVNWIDMSASRIYKSAIIPSREDVPGFLSIYNPVMAVNSENNESFILDATLMTPFINYSKNTRIIAQAVWNERNMRCNVMWQRPKNFDALLIHAPTPRGYVFPVNTRPAQVNSGKDIQTVLMAFWLLHKDTLTNVIIDASISMTAEDLLMLLKFCVLNGLELDIYAREVPSLGLTRASAFTGGHTIYSMSDSINLPTHLSHMQIQIPLPQELSSSGYPGRSMLAMYLDAGLIQSRSWIPLYPDMFELQ